MSKAARYYCSHLLAVLLLRVGALVLLVAANWSLAFIGSRYHSPQWVPSVNIACWSIAGILSAILTLVVYLRSLKAAHFLAPLFCPIFVIVLLTGMFITTQFGMAQGEADLGLERRQMTGIVDAILEFKQIHGQLPNSTNLPLNLTIPATWWRSAATLKFYFSESGEPVFIYTNKGEAFRFDPTRRRWFQLD